MKKILQFLAAVLLSGIPMMSQTTGKSGCGDGPNEIVAMRATHAIVPNAARPSPEWEAAHPITFCAEWNGKNPDPGRQTRVRVLWTPEALYLRFECRYREIHVFPDSDPSGRRDQLWDRDVAEAFLQPDPSQPHAYKEFEVSPNGMWIDLDIAPGQKPDLKSGLSRSVFLDERAGVWTAELGIPMRALTKDFDPHAEWRVNFFRVEGTEEPRAYYAWRATNTPQPNFHVPSAFGHMRFAGQAK